MNYCFLDLETTGLDPQKDSIIEISLIVKNKTGATLESYDEVIIPSKTPLTPYVTHLTGISEKEISERGNVLSTVQKIVQTKIADSVIVGHNIDFDIQFLIANGIDVSHNSRIDTHELIRIISVNEESYSLEVLSQKYGFTHTTAHRAMSDVEACIDLFYFLQKRIDSLPQEFLEKAREFLQHQTWFAKELFKNAKGVPTAPSKKIATSVEENLLPFPPKVLSLLEKVSKEKSLFIRQQDSLSSASLVLSLAQKFSKEHQKTLIISPKLDFFSSVKKFPTPEVLLDPEKFSEWGLKKNIDDGRTVFYLQCLFRQFLEIRGVFDFNLFAGQRDYWAEVCITDPNHSVFQKITQERESEDILAISPSAFFRFHELDIFRERILLIDEGELFAEKLLFSPTKEHSLLPYLNSENNTIATSAHFFVTNFCREVIEPQLQHGIGPFPEKILISSDNNVSRFVEQISPLGADAEISALIAILSKNSGTRWARYFPDNGNLLLGIWHAEDWRNLKQSLHQFRKIFFYRHKPSESNAFFRVFTGCQEGIWYEDQALETQKKLEIPENLVSANSPEFGTFCAEKILEIAKENVDKDHFLAVNFSSLETLRKIYSDIFQQLLECRISLLGEKASGGDGKLLQFIQQESRMVLFTQKLIHPDFSRLPFTHLVIQKFPFSPPHPLLEEIERVMKDSGQSFWDTWTIPQTASNISRRISVFPHAKKVIWLDPRENSSWGKTILDSIFG